METLPARVLCTEDHADTRELIRLVFGNAGFEVTCMDCAEGAVRLAQTENFDLYLLDNWLPGLSGVGLCEKLREFDVKTPILFYSGAAFAPDKQHALESGAQGYLTKPVDGDVLVATVRELIEEARLAPKSHSMNAGRA
jgi:DNA-binding response OmpR family regulator